MIASMIAVELMRIVFSAAPTGPTGSRIPRLHAPVSRLTAAAMALRFIGLALPRPGDPNGTRTRVFAVKGRRPRPLDDGAASRSGSPVRRGPAQRQATRGSSKRGILEVHLGRVAAVPFVALDRARQPPAPVARRGKEGLAELGRGAAEGDPFEALAIVAARDPADMAVADDAGPHQPDRARGDVGPRPAGAIGSRRIERVAQGPCHSAGRKQGIEQQRAVAARLLD